jgi:hypothetical protein
MIVATGTSGEFSSKFTSLDKANAESYLGSAFAGDHKDPSTGAPVEFKFNVQCIDYSCQEEKLNKDGSFKLSKDGSIKMKTVLMKMNTSDVAKEIVARSEKVDNNGTTFPAFVVGQEGIPGTDGGETTVGIKIDFNSKEGASSALGHEVLHFMLDRYQIPGSKSDNIHHNLGGLLGRPLERPYINENILNKLKQHVPRSSKDDKIVTP